MYFKTKISQYIALLTIWSILNIDIVNPQTSKLFCCLNSSEMIAGDQSGGGGGGSGIQQREMSE